jgi:ribosome maturation factor RimP
MGGLEEVRDLAEAVVARRSLILWDVTVEGRPGAAVFKVFVDGPDGVDLDTLADVSEELSRGLDLRDPVPGRYTLEVSSPGLERTLRSPAHFTRSVGKKVVVKTKERLANNSHRLEGVIADTDDSTVTLRTESDEVAVPYDEIRAARTIFEWK